jgi:hypothetical protein
MIYYYLTNLDLCFPLLAEIVLMDYWVNRNLPNLITAITCYENGDCTHQSDFDTYQDYNYNNTTAQIEKLDNFAYNQSFPSILRLDL